MWLLHQGGVAVLLLGSAAIAAGAAAGGGSDAAAIAERDHRCRHISLSELNLLYGNGSNYVQIFWLCNEACPLTVAPDLRASCNKHHAFHDSYYTFTEAQTHRQKMTWNIFFICCGTATAARW